MKRKIEAKIEFSFGQNMIRGHPAKQNEGDCSKPCRGHYLRLPLHPVNKLGLNSDVAIHIQYSVGFYLLIFGDRHFLLHSLPNVIWRDLTMRTRGQTLSCPS